MFLRESRPTFDSGACFICELSPETEYVDTLFNFEPAVYTPLEGRKFVCRYCVEEMAKLIGFEDPTEYREQLDELQVKVGSFEDVYAEVKKLFKSVK